MLGSEASLSFKKKVDSVAESAIMVPLMLMATGGAQIGQSGIGNGN